MKSKYRIQNKKKRNRMPWQQILNERYNNKNKNNKYYGFKKKIKTKQKQKTCIFIRGKEHNITEQNRNASKQAKKICRRQSNIHLTRKRMKRRQ